MADFYKFRNLILCFLFCVQYEFVSAQSYVPEKNNTVVRVKPSIPIQAYSFNLNDVKLLDGPFKHARQLDSAYLLLLSPDRLLYRFYKNAHLPVKDSVYGGWESEGLSGHTMGHYLSACALMFAATQQPEFNNRSSYIVDELQRCQVARKTGYVGAIPEEDSIFTKVARGEIKAASFSLNGGWSPWYTVHKLMAGLLDVYLYCNNQKALAVVKGMADWTFKTISHLPDSLRLKMLNCEYGGMNEVLANLYAFTGDKKYLDLSYKFYDEFVMGKLAEQIDPMPGKHSNTNVPKAIGSARQYELTANKRDSTIAAFFWKAMVDHHTYAIGGNSNYEYCGEQGKLSDRLSDKTCETCNTYNMLKLTRHLFSWRPNSVYGDYYERALYNHILASQNPRSGMVCYFVPLRMGTIKQFSDSFNTFTCCVGSGMENHSKYGEGIYYEANDGGLYVNLYIASELRWKSRGITIRQQTNFPEGDQTELIIHSKQDQEFTIYLRKPFWTSGATLTINGSNLAFTVSDNGFIAVKRKWRNNDKLKLTLPMNLYTESMPDNPDRVAIKYGPMVMAAQLGNVMPDPLYGVPALVTSNRSLNDWIKPSSGSGVAFETKAAVKPFDVRLVPFYKVYDQYYSVYWDYLNEKEWQSRQEEYAEVKKKQKDIEDRTIDFFAIGETEAEKKHQLKASEQSYVDDALGKKGREARAGNFFSFDMKLDSAISQNLLLTYIGDDKDRKFDILVNGIKIKTETWQGGATSKFYDVEYALPQDMTKGKTRVIVRIEANYGKTAGRIFAARIVKSKI